MSKRRLCCYAVSLLFFLFAVSFPAKVSAAEGVAPQISASPLVLEVGSTYDPLDGLTVVDDKDTSAELLSKMKFYDMTDPTTVGFYDIFYYVTDSDGNEASFNRPVLVLDPNLPLIYAAVSEVLMGDSVDILKNVYAYDLQDGDLTSLVTIAEGTVDTSFPGEYSILLEVYDSDGHRAEQTKVIVVLWPPEYYPVITAEDIYIPMGQDFDLFQGVTAQDKTDGDLTGSLKLDYSNVDTSTPGIYWTQFFVENSLGLVDYQDRRVFVYDPASTPVILAEDIYLETGMAFAPYDGIAAYDVEDGDLTHLVIITENTVDTTQAGEYFVRYQVTDSDGNTAETLRRVTVEWSYEYYPRIVLDSPEIYLAVNASFDPYAGVTATDPNDGDLTSQIVITSENIDTSQAGQYYIEYTVTNSRGISTWEYRVVYVLSSSLPVIEAYDFSSGLNEPLDLYMMHFEAYDLEDGNLRESVAWDISQVNIAQAGVYPITLQVTDSDGNSAQASCNVTIIDYSYPELHVYDHVAYLNTDYDPLQYASAWDREDGNLTHQIVVVKNTVKIKKPGIYYVTYSVTNSQGNTTSATVSVEVMKEPVYSFVLTYEGLLIPLDTDENGNFAFIHSDVLIPAGAEVGIGVFADGEPVFEIMGITNLHDIQPGFTYFIEINDNNELLTMILPYLYQGTAYRISPSEGEIQFKSTVSGTLYYVLGETGTPLPEMDFTGEGQRVTPGQNTLKIGDLRPGRGYSIRMMVVAENGETSNLYELEIPKMPSKKNKPDKKVKEEPVVPREVTPAEAPMETPLERELPAEPQITDPSIEQPPPVETIPLSELPPTETPPEKIADPEQPEKSIAGHVKNLAPLPDSKPSKNFGLHGVKNP